MLENSIDYIGNQVLDGIEQLLEVNERQLALNVSVLGQVATSAGGLRSIRLRYAEDVSQSRTRRLKVQLRRLSQIGL